MATQAINAMAMLPTPWFWNSGNLTYASMLLDASGKKAAAIFTNPKTGQIRKVGFRTGTVTTGCTVTVRLESVDATTGAPSGTDYSTNTDATQVIQSTDDNIAFLVQLTADSVSINRGVKLAVTVEWGTGGNLNIVKVNSIAAGDPYTALYTGTWALTSGPPIVFIEYTDGTTAVIPGAAPWININTDSFASNAERALYFQLKCPKRAIGAWIYGDFDGDAEVNLYDLSNNAKVTAATIDKDIRSSANNAMVTCLFSDSYLIPINTFHRLAVKSTTATSINVYNVETYSAAHMDAMDGGQNMYYSARASAGAWVETTTKRPMIGLIYDAEDDGVSSGFGSGTRRRRIYIPPNLVIRRHMPLIQSVVNNTTIQQLFVQRRNIRIENVYRLNTHRPLIESATPIINNYSVYVRKNRITPVIQQNVKYVRPIFPTTTTTTVYQIFSTKKRITPIIQQNIMRIRRTINTQSVVGGSSTVLVIRPRKVM